MRVALKNVRPNPFRDMDAYPIHALKIRQLKRSINSTDFWDNVVARKSATEPGCIEIAYGHHRLTALLELFDGEKEFNWIVRDLDDGDMLRIMANENLDEWGHSSDIERETIRAVVQAYADGRVALRMPDKSAKPHNFRYAPSFLQGKQPVTDMSRELPRPKFIYTADTLHAFLGGTMDAEGIKDTLQALELMELGHLTEEQVKGLSSEKARALVREVNRSVNAAKAIQDKAEREARNAATPVLAKKVKQEADKQAKQVVKQTASAVSKTMQKGASISEAKQEGHRARATVAPEQAAPGINDAATRVATAISKLLDPSRDPAKRLEQILEFKQHLEPNSINNLDRALEMLVEDAQGYRARLK